MVLVVLVTAVIGAASHDTWSPYYRISAFDADGHTSRPTRRTAGTAGHVRRRHPPPDHAHLVRGGGERPPRPDLPLVPGSDVRQRPDHRRGQRLRHRARGRQARRPRRRGRDRPGARQDRPRVPPRGRLHRPAGHGQHQRRPRVPPRDRQEVRPDRLRPDRLADARHVDRQRPARVVPVHRAGAPERAGPPDARPACSSCTTSTASHGWSRSSTGWRPTSSAMEPIAPHRRSDRGGDRRGSGRRGASASEAARRPGRRAARRSRARRPMPATDDWPFLYLREPQVAPYYLVALAFLLGFAVLDGRRRREGDRDRRPAPQPALLRPRRRVPAARDEEPRDVQPAVRHDLARQRDGLLRDPRQRAARDRGQPALPAAAAADPLRRAARRDRRRVAAARRTAS